jgi:hypothetical protein
MTTWAEKKAAVSAALDAVHRPEAGASKATKDHTQALWNLITAIADGVTDSHGTPRVYVMRGPESRTGATVKLQFFTIDRTDGNPRWLMWTLSHLTNHKRYRGGARDYVVGRYLDPHDVLNDALRIIDRKLSDVNVEVL